MTAKVIRFPKNPVTAEEILKSVEDTVCGEKKPRSLAVIAVDEYGQATVWCCGLMSDLPFVALNFQDLALRHINGMIIDEEE